MLFRSALVENARRVAVIQEAREYARIISEIAEAGVDPSEVFGEFYEGEIQLNEILSSIWNYLKSWWTSGLKKIRDKADQQAISNAMQALAQLQQDIPKFGEKPSAEFEKSAQQFINAVQAATGGAPDRARARCLCGDIRLDIQYPAFWAWHDHSEASRRTHGAAYAT